MENVTLRAFDTTKAHQELLPEYLGLEPMTAPEHRGRKHITYSPNGDPAQAQNIGILNPDGSTEAQPGYAFSVEAE